MTGAPADLGTVSVDSLLTAFAALTHRIHAYEGSDGHKRGSATGLRMERDMVKDEIKRRVGES